MRAIDTIPSRVKYYLLDFKDTHYQRFWLMFNKEALKDLTLEELTELLEYVAKYDKEVILNEAKSRSDSEGK